MQDWLTKRPTRVTQVLKVVIACHLLLGMVALAAPIEKKDSLLDVADGGVDGSASTLTDETLAGAGPSSTDPTTANGGTASTQTTTKGSSPTNGGPGGGLGPGAPSWIPVASGTHGVTDTKIQLGMVDADLGSTMGALNEAGGNGGASGTPTGGVKMRTAVDTIVRHINANGGLAGRGIEIVWAPVDASRYLASNSSRQQEQQRVCATFTEDHHVFAFSAIALNEELVFECARKSKTPMVAVGYQGYLDQARFEKMADYWYAPHGLIAERRERALAKDLLAQGFFTPGAKVGILTEDKPSIRKGVDLGMKPVLQAAGIPFEEIVYKDPVNSPWDNYAAQLIDVKHVIMSATTFSLYPTLGMMRAIDTQQRTDVRWGIASDNEPDSLGGPFGGAPRRQMANVFGMGWRPFRDTRDLTPQSATTTECREVFKKANISPNHAGDSFCEFFFFLRAGFKRMDVISPAALATAVNGAGTSIPGVWTIGGATSYSAARHDGPNTIRTLRFDERCDQVANKPCFKYVGDSRPLPG